MFVIIQEVSGGRRTSIVVSGDNNGLYERLDQAQGDRDRCQRDAEADRSPLAFRIYELRPAEES